MYVSASSIIEEVLPVAGAGTVRACTCIQLKEIDRGEIRALINMHCW